MFVQSATIGLASSYSLSVTRSRTETATAWIGDRRPDSSETTTTSSSPTRARDADPTISQAARDMLLRSQSQASALSARSAVRNASDSSLMDISTGNGVRGRKAVDGQGAEIELSPEDELKVRMIEDLLSRLFGHKVRLSHFKGMRLSADDPKDGNRQNVPPGAPAGTAPARVGWGIEVSIHEKETREERSDFQAVGEIRTADGKVMNLSMRLTMASSTTRESSFLFQAGDAIRKDPLVLNFGGAAADLTDATFAFDLEGDGSMEHIAFATGQTAFLARKSSGSGETGVPTDGTALFGTISGDGFGDLAALDEDGNGWVDEGDSAWKDLVLWQRDEGGNDVIRSLASRGVGALYVGSVSTPFELGSGAVAETGLWVSEGADAAGTIQHIDLSV